MLSEKNMERFLKDMDAKCSEQKQNFCWCAVIATLKIILEKNAKSDIALMEAAASTELDGNWWDEE